MNILAQNADNLLLIYKTLNVLPSSHFKDTFSLRKNFVVLQKNF